MYSQNSSNNKGIALLHIVIGIIIIVVILNILFSIFSAFNQTDDREIDIDIHRPYYYGGTKYKKYPSTYPPSSKTYGSDTAKKLPSNSKFQERFSSKTQSSSFSSRFASKYGRSRTSSFRTSGFFGGK